MFKNNGFLDLFQSFLCAKIWFCSGIFSACLPDFLHCQCLCSASFCSRLFSSLFCSSPVFLLVLHLICFLTHSLLLLFILLSPSSALFLSFPAFSPCVLCSFKSRLLSSFCFWSACFALLVLPNPFDAVLLHFSVVPLINFYKFVVFVSICSVFNFSVPVLFFRWIRFLKLFSVLKIECTKI